MKILVDLHKHFYEIYIIADKDFLADETLIKNFVNASIFFKFP